MEDASWVLALEILDVPSGHVDSHCVRIDIQRIEALARLGVSRLLLLAHSSKAAKAKAMLPRRHSSLYVGITQAVGDSTESLPRMLACFGSEYTRLQQKGISLWVTNRSLSIPITVFGL